MKVDRKIYKGIEYIQVQELPGAQQEKLMLTLDHELFIKIMIDGKIVSQCLQYKDYCNWYDCVFVVKTTPVKETSVEETLRIPSNLALNKI